MQCVIEKELFLEGLSGVVQILLTKTTYPVLQNVFLESTGDNLIVKATDLDSYVEKRLPLTEKGKSGKVIVSGKKLLEAVRELSADKLSLTLKDSRVYLEADGSTSIFSGLDPTEFPEVPSLPQDNEIEFPLATLEEIFKATSFATSKDESRPAICGVYWKVSPTETRMVATDTYRLAFAKKKGKFGGKLEVIIAPKIFALFPKGVDKIKVCVDPAKIGLVFPNTTIISRLIEGPYPDYERIMPKQYPFRMQTNVVNFSSALRRAAVFAHPAGRLVILNLSVKESSIFAETQDLGQTTQMFDADYEGDDLKIGFNVDFLLEVLKHIDSDEVIMEFLNPLAAGVVKPASSESEIEKIYLLMPIRLE
ncbi:MAG: DNA polymerase III subunit beta [candidate division WOR-3 bacterium]|nr:DNA polymerase III subunit beta [candidate division WOR-3 bacterium]